MRLRCIEIRSFSLHGTGKKYKFKHQQNHLLQKIWKQNMEFLQVRNG